MDILNELQPIFRDIFDDDSLVLTNELNAEMLEDWDSLSNIRLIIAIEKLFGIKFAFGEVSKMKNVGEMIRVIEEKLGQNTFPDAEK
jgi:acyl carrier protein